MTTYLRRSEVMPVLLEACPSFRPRWEEHVAWSGYEPLLHVDISEFGTHVAELAHRGNHAALPLAFAAIERLLAEGDDDVQNAVAVSFLEELGGHFGSFEAAERMVGRHFGARTAADWREITAPINVWDRLRRWWRRRSMPVSQN
jgi:hypothetical protein